MRKMCVSHDFPITRLYATAIIDSGTNFAVKLPPGLKHFFLKVFFLHVNDMNSSTTDLLLLRWVGVMGINSDMLSSGVFGQLSTADPIQQLKLSSQENPQRFKKTLKKVL